MALDYDYGSREDRGWLIAERPNDPGYRGKLESLFALANGYMGVRAATEEASALERRGFFVAGIFDCFPGEVTELANLPDWLFLEIEIEGERFSSSCGRVRSYVRSLNLRTGELVRSLEWESPGGRRVRLRFERFVSMADRHTAAIRITVEALNFAGTLSIHSGIDGQVTNSGVQHLLEGELRLLDGRTIALLAETQQSGIGVCIAATHRYALDGVPLAPREALRTGRRRILLDVETPVEIGRRLSVEKTVAVSSTRDGGSPAAAERAALLHGTAGLLERNAALGYRALFSAHEEAWRELWRRAEVEIDGPQYDQLALRFALFHILQMTPRDDSRVSIAAKGLSGEGYKGHVFWDTEIFLLPVFTYTMPETAARLLEYRHRTLDGARAKARSHGFRGAMYPWESADTGEETTPEFASVDIESGQRIPILSGDIEQHISVDVPYAVWHYYHVTGDLQFLLAFGLEILLETARFWASRLEWSEERSRYEMSGIMGPDEYGEHVSNNAYTNFMVQWHLRRTAGLHDELRGIHRREIERVEKKIGLDPREPPAWRKMADRIFTNIDEATGFICQYDGFTEKLPVELSAYRGKVGSITRDYGWAQLMQMQVVKQADTVMLLYLRGEDFSDRVKRLNWGYYEPRTLHDSSLSPAIHAIVASDIGERDRAYEYFQHAARIDLGPQANGSGDGLHAASLGGLWQATVNGFGGVRVGDDGRLCISPRLPEKWSRLRFAIQWRGRRLGITVTEALVSVEASGAGGPFELRCEGSLYSHPGEGRLEVPCSGSDS